MNLPTISIIIPVYQVENYIEECLNSIGQQTYKGDVECLLIDDCGQDSTMDKVKQFIASYKGSISFNIIRQDKNRGVSAARNTGIRAAKGDYLMLMDDDDIIAPNCLEILAECLLLENIDMVCGGFKTIDGYYPLWSDGYQLSDYQSSTPNEIIDFYASGKLYEMPWNKLVRKDVVINHNIYFKEGIVYEDKLWVFLLVNHITSLKTVSKVTYFWRIHSKSQWNDPLQITKRINGGVIFQEEMQRLIKVGKIKPTTQTIFKIRREKNRTGGAIIRCKSLSFRKKMAYMYRLMRLPGCHHFLYALIRHYKKYENNPL